MTVDVSILIPAFNAEEWIEQAVESALSQGSHCEVIVVDDGSSDRTVERLSNFGDRIRWESGPNRGAPAARNRLLNLASADWLQYLDADDYLLPGKIEVQRDALLNNYDADVIYGPISIEWHDRDQVHTTVLDIPEPRDPWILLALWRLPQTGSPLWRKSALEEVGGWREDQSCCQEHELYLRLLMAGKRLVYDPAGGAVYRKFSGGSLSSRNISRVRVERAKIESRIERHLASVGALTEDRQLAIDQARFELARSTWPESRSQARLFHDSIKSRWFRPTGPAAPALYRLAYKVLGFEGAEILAGLTRSTKLARPYSFKRS